MNFNSNSNAPLLNVLKKIQDVAKTPFEESSPIPAEANKDNASIFFILLFLFIYFTKILRILLIE